ncbi:methionyl-tRNA formyltransferase [Bradyrhizobium sp.]|uniref:methionyl-tRNA formyltransferase n=1 Tax=Bradyrhizobium sp. TaxID=376 RepID=UPI00262F5B0F|nr:methionyl-tRNA formyltransferase [Bradyrhizobium sp.]
MSLRLVFMGTPQFAVPTLRVLHDEHEIVAIYTRAPKPGGRRGLELQPTHVELEARHFGIPLKTPSTLRTPEALDEFRAFHADAAVVVAYGMILPKPILDATKLGCFNLHASLLPRWRGAAPIERAIMSGDAETGVTVMKMNVGLDTGDIASAESVEITDETTEVRLRSYLAGAGARLMRDAMRALERGTLQFTPQPSEGVTYAAKINKAEARVVWNKPAGEILRQIHAFSPFPGAWCEMSLDGSTQRVKILLCEIAEGSGAPGAVLDDRLTIACQQGAIRVLELQRAGKQPMKAEEFLRGTQLKLPVRLS